MFAVDYQKFNLVVAVFYGRRLMRAMARGRAVLQSTKCTHIFVVKMRTSAVKTK